MRYDPIMCMMVPDTVKTQDELSLSQKKQVVTELKGFLKKSYNFSDESEYARAYEDLRHMFTTGSRKSISGLFENAVKKTGAHDSVKTKDAMFVQLRFSICRTEGAKLEENEYREYAEALLKKYGEKMVTLSKNGKAIATYMNRSKLFNDSNTIDKAIRSCDEQIRLVKTISKKNGYAIHIVEGGYGERVVLTFPNESYANPHMWLGSNNPSNIQKAKELLDEFSK